MRAERGTGPGPGWGGERGRGGERGWEPRTGRNCWNRLAQTCSSHPDFGKRQVVRPSSSYEHQLQFAVAETGQAFASLESTQSAVGEGEGEGTAGSSSKVQKTDEIQSGSLVIYAHTFFVILILTYTGGATQSRNYIFIIHLHIHLLHFIHRKGIVPGLEPDTAAITRPQGIRRSHLRLQMINGANGQTEDDTKCAGNTPRPVFHHHPDRCRVRLARPRRQRCPINGVIIHDRKTHSRRHQQSAYRDGAGGATLMPSGPVLSPIYIQMCN